MNNDLIIILNNVATAARILRYVRETIPGDDLGLEATARATIALNLALDRLVEFEGEPAFDLAAGYKFMNETFRG